MRIQKHLLIFSILVLLVFTQNQTSAKANKEVILDHGIGSSIYNIAKGLNNKQQYYVQIGAYDPIHKSSTLGLDMLGWTGINISPIYSRLSQFYNKRNHQLNLNLRIGNQSKNSVVEYNQKFIGEFVKPVLTSEQKVSSPLKTQKVSQITLSQLCMKYYQKRPNFIFISLGNDANSILPNNNWLDQKCIPDVFVIDVSTSIQNPNNVKNYYNLLSDKNFLKTQIQIENYQVFVKKDFISQYTSNYERNVKNIQTNRTVLKFSDVLVNISKIIKANVTEQNLAYGSAVVDFLHPNQIVSLNSLAKKFPKKSSTSASGSKTPIILFNYNPFQHAIVLQNCDFKITKIQAPTLSLVHIQTQNLQGEISIYIFDHVVGGVKQWQPQLIIMDEKCRSNPSTGQYKDIHQNSDKLKNLKENLNYVQTTVQSGLSLGDYIIQLVFSIVFITAFLVFSITVLVFLCISLETETKLQKQNLQLMKNNQTEMVSSTIKTQQVVNS